MEIYAWNSVVVVKNSIFAIIIADLFRPLGAEIISMGDFVWIAAMS
jgi:hypothetical protein